MTVNSRVCFARIQRHQFRIAGIGLLLATVIASPQTVAEAVNIAPLGTGIMGVNSNDDGSLGTPLANSGTAANVNDDNLATRVDTFNFSGPETFDWAGVLFGSDVSNIGELKLYHATFSDGGWFASDNINTDASLEAPKIQVTTDGGTVWTDVSGVTDDYVATLTGNVPSGVAFLQSPATFTFNALGPVNGIRVFGNGGGSASGGFFGVYEIEVFLAPPVPEPSSCLLLGLGLIGLRLGRTRRRQRSRKAC